MGKHSQSVDSRLLARIQAKRAGWVFTPAHFVADGTVSARYEFGPFGETIRSSGSVADENPFRYSTKRMSRGCGVVLFERRPYISSLGRWLSRDPIEEEGGLNLFAMLDNEPLSYVDLLGLKDCDPVIRSNVRYDFDSEKLPKPPIPGVFVDGRLRVEIQITKQNCKVCCSDGRKAWESDVRIRGFVRAGITITAGLKGNYPLTQNWGVDYWAGIRGELAGQGEVNAQFLDSECSKREGTDICFGVRIFGRLSIGGQARMKMGRWGVATAELTGNGELSNLNQFCLRNCTKDGCSGVTREDGPWTGKLFARACFGFTCLTWNLWGADQIAD